MGDRGGQLAHRHHARHARELRPRHLQRIFFSSQRFLRQLAIADVPRKRQAKAFVRLLKHAGANLDREHDAILAPVQCLERDRLAGADPLRQPRERGLVEPDIEIARVHADQFFTAVSKAVAGLTIDIDNEQSVVMQEEGVSRMVDKGAKARLARRAAPPRHACAP